MFSHRPNRCFFAAVCIPFIGTILLKGGGGVQADDKFRVVVDILYYAALGAAVYFAVRYLLCWTLPFFLGAGVAALLRPATLKFAKKTRMKASCAAVLVLLFFYLVAAGMLALFLTILLAQLYELLLRLPELYAENVAPLFDQLSGWFYGLAGRFGASAEGGLEQFSGAVSDTIRQAAVDGSTHLVSWAAGLAAKLPILLIAAVFTVVISMLTATGYRQVGAFLCGLFPGKWEERLRGLQRFGRETVWKMVRAYTIIVAVTFLELLAGLWLLGFQYVLPVAAAIALLDILPLIGTGTILVPWGIVLIAGGDLVGGVGLILLFALIEVLRNILEPRIVGNQIGLHPIVTITAMYAGLKIAGFWGMLAAPVAVLLGRYLWTGAAPERRAEA